MKIVYIPINEEGLDDFFIYKHKIEKLLECDNHIPYSTFMKDYVFGKDMLTFYDSDTKEAIPFSIYTIDDEIAIFYTSNNDDSLLKLKKILNAVNYSFDNFHTISQYDSTMIDRPDETLSFFIKPNGSMLVSDETRRSFHL